MLPSTRTVSIGTVRNAPSDVLLYTLSPLERCMYLCWYYFGLYCDMTLVFYCRYTFRLNQTSWNTWKVHVFVLILFWACTVTLVFYCSYIQAEPNFLEHLKGACICIDIILGLYCNPCLLLQLHSGWTKLLGTLERCMYLYWYYFGLVL